MIPEALTDNIVAKQLPGLLAGAEALMSVAAWADLPAGLRIVPMPAGRLAGFSIGSGHGLARAHGFRPGRVAVAVAAEGFLRRLLELWPDDTATGLAEAGVYVEFTAAHELAHALIARPDDELRDGEGEILRRLPEAAATIERPDRPERTARDHGAAWAAGIVILAGRCARYRPGARHRWPRLLGDDLQAVGIDAEAVALAVGDVADELPLRELLAPERDIVRRVAEAIPDDEQRARLIADRLIETSSADPGHVAPVAAGEAL